MAGGRANGPFGRSRKPPCEAWQSCSIDQPMRRPTSAQKSGRRGLLEFDVVGVDVEHVNPGLICKRFKNVHDIGESFSKALAKALVPFIHDLFGKIWRSVEPCRSEVKQVGRCHRGHFYDEELVV